MKQKLKEIAVGLGFGIPALVVAASVHDSVPGGAGTLLGGVMILAAVIGGYITLDWIGSGRKPKP